MIYFRISVKYIRNNSTTNAPWCARLYLASNEYFASKYNRRKAARKEKRKKIYVVGSTQNKKIKEKYVFVKRVTSTGSRLYYSIP